MNNPVIDVRNVSKNFKEKIILKDLSLVVPQGSVFGLLGKNGSGKTTLIKSILGLLRVKSGEIMTLGDNPWEFSDENKAKLGYVPQADRMYPWLTVSQLIDYTASFYSHWNSALVNKLLYEWEVNGEDKVGLLSEGQAQKLSIILSLGHEPQLLVFDEPVASLDPLSRRKFLKTILDIIADRECTIFFSTHITSDIERVADRVAILKNGQIDFCGELDSLKDEVKRLRVTTKDNTLEDFNFEGILSCEKSANEAIVSVRGFDETMKVFIEKTWDAKVTIEDLNLEEIFLELNR